MSVLRRVVSLTGYHFGVADPAVSLNDAQIAVLRWIAAGSPAGVMEEGYSHCVSAAALRNRSLVRISGR